MQASAVGPTTALHADGIFLSGFAGSE